MPSNRATASGIISTSEKGMWTSSASAPTRELGKPYTVEPAWTVESEQSEPGSETRGANLAVSLRLLDQVWETVACLRHHPLKKK